MRSQEVAGSSCTEGAEICAFPPTEEATIYVRFPYAVGLSKKDALDKAAEQTTALTKITDNTRLPVSYYKNQYRSLILES